VFVCVLTFQNFYLETVFYSNQPGLVLNLVTFPCIGRCCVGVGERGREGGREGGRVGGRESVCVCIAAASERARARARASEERERERASERESIVAAAEGGCVIRDPRPPLLMDRVRHTENFVARARARDEDVPQGRGTLVDVLGSRGVRCVVKWDESLPNGKFGGTSTTCDIGYDCHAELCDSLLIVCVCVCKVCERGVCVWYTYFFCFLHAHAHTRACAIARIHTDRHSVIDPVVLSILSSLLFLPLFFYFCFSLLLLISA
jgi:hypothetical protein